MKSKTFTEQEIKFRLPDGGDPARIRSTIEAAGFRLEPEAGVTHEDRYLDTEDWVLFRAGIALRLRADGRRVRLEAKTLRSTSDEAMVRTEWAQDAPAGDPPWDALAFEPGPVTGLLWPLRGLGVPERLRVRAVLRNDRECFRWSRDDAPLGSVTVDHVALPEMPGAPPAPAAVARRFDEVEVELANGHGEALAEVRRAVESELGLLANVESKLKSALAVAGLAAPSRNERAYRATPGDRLVDVAWKTLARQFGRIEWHEPGSRLGIDPESVHDMRVASRRARMALEVFPEAVPEESRARFAEELRFVGRALGRVRDLDVALERVAAMESEAGEEEQAALRVFDQGLRIRRERRRVALIEALDSERYAGLLALMREWIDAGPPAPSTVQAGGIPAFYAAPRIVGEAGRTMEAAYEVAERTLEPEAVHALRLAAKRARYACEFFAPVLGPQASARAKRISKLQDVLGFHQDAVMLLARLRKYARTIPRRDHTLTLGAGSALGVLERMTRVKRGELRRAWAETAAPEA